MTVDEGELKHDPDYKYTNAEQAVKAALKQIDEEAMKVSYSLPHCAGLRVAANILRHHLALVRPPEAPISAMQDYRND